MKIFYASGLPPASPSLVHYVSLGAPGTILQHPSCTPLGKILVTSLD